MFEDQQIISSSPNSLKAAKEVLSEDSRDLLFCKTSGFQTGRDIGHMGKSLNPYWILPGWTGIETLIVSVILIVFLIFFYKIEPQPDVLCSD